MRAVCVLLLLCADVLLPALGSAQDREAARVAYEEGARQHQAGNHQLALENFLRVRELLRGDPRSEALAWFNIARSYDALGRAEEALRAYEQYLADAPSDAPNREQTLDRVRDLRGRVAASRRAGGASGGTPLVPIGIVVASIGAGALVASIPTGLVALDREQQLAAMCDEGRCPQSAQGVLDDAYLLGTLTDVLWIAGLSVAVIGAALFAIGLAVEPQPDAPAAGAACTEDGCVATVRTRF